MFDEVYVSWTEQVIAAHKSRLSERQRDRRGELIACWERARRGDNSTPAVELALEFVADGNANEVELGFYVTMDLALIDPVVQCHLTDLASHRSAPVRRRLAYYLSPDFPRELLTEIYRTLLHDKAASVRVQAIEAVGAREYRELLTELRAARSSELNTKVIKSLNYWIPLLEVGFRVERCKVPDTLSITVATGNGTVSRLVNAADPDDPIVLRAVAELRGLRKR